MMLPLFIIVIIVIIVIITQNMQFNILTGLFLMG